MSVNRTLFAASTLLLMAGCPQSSDEPLIINSAPTADAGTAITQAADSVVQLDGRASFDPDGDALTFYWTFEYVPQGSTLTEMTAPFTPNHDDSGITSFQPDVVGVYLVKLEVYDGRLYSQGSTVVVNATEPSETPIAHAGPDLSMALGEGATLDGTQSTDPMGNPLSYSWTLVEVPFNSALTEASLNNADQRVSDFEGDVLGWYTATLVVHNGLTFSAPDSARVQVTGDNQSPTSNAGGDLADYDCTHIQLDCSGSTDPEGDQLTYWWVLQSKPGTSAVDNRSFSDQSADKPTFYADVAGDYSVSCSVFDGTSWSYPASIDLTLEERDVVKTNIPPLANAGADVNIDAGTADCEEDGYQYDCESCPAQTTELGVEASDADGDPLTILWTVKEESEGTLVGVDAIPVKAILSQTTPEEPSACVDETFSFELAVTDCPGDTTTDDVNVTVTCCGVEG